jgi:D-serine deaminase-like pyridoxal phosphate-dependent protein
MHYKELSTPALVIDLDILERNLDHMAAYCQERGLALRPHTKTHKTPEVAWMQIDRGAAGVTVAKVGEAEVLAEAGLDDILIAYPVWGADKLRRIAELAGKRRLTIALDHEATAQALSQALAVHNQSINVLVEFDSGVGRCGLASGTDCVELASKVAKLAGLRFRGLLTYYGNIWGVEEQRRAEAAVVADRIAGVLRSFSEARIPVDIVSGGSTPAAFLSDSIPGVTEIRPGTYVYNDLNTFYQDACRLEDCAARVVTSVVSTAVRGRAILDAGSKTLSSDRLSSGPKTGFGHIVESPDAQLFELSEEHGSVNISRAANPLKVGDVVTVIPNHVCTCVNMHDEAFVVRRDEVLGSWKIAGRGKIR